MSDQPIKCVQDVLRIPPRVYAMPGDSQKASALRKKRKLLAVYLAGAANPDGSGITLAVDTMAEATGESRRTTLRLLDDLKALGFLEDGKLTRWNGTRIRRLVVGAIITAVELPNGIVGVPDSQPVEVPNSTDRSAKQDALEVPNSVCSSAKPDGVEVPRGNVGVPSMVGTVPFPDRHPTATPPPPDRQEKNGGGAGVSQKELAAMCYDVILAVPEEMQKAPMTAADRKRMEVALTKYGTKTFIAVAKRWAEQRSMPVPNLAWKFFWLEHVPALHHVLQEEWKRSPEGIKRKAEAEAKEKEYQDRWIYQWNFYCYLTQGFIPLMTKESLPAEYVKAIGGQYPMPAEAFAPIHDQLKELAEQEKLRREIADAQEAERKAAQDAEDREFLRNLK